ncbi:hypothetical protein QEM15_001672 [Pseudomonas putida]|nr:hypothetical protein [Pseudomonas putida]
MNFLDLVVKGVEKSNKALAAVAEVDRIYEQINADLKKFTAGELMIVRKTSTMAQLSSFAAGVASATGGAVGSEYFKHDRISIVLTVGEKTFSEDVAGWKQRVTGYPCILKFDGQELSCGNSQHLLNGMSELLSSVGFGNAINKLLEAAKKSEAARQRKDDVVDTPSNLTAVAGVKLALISGDKVSAKAKVAKAAAKPLAAKAPAKTTTRHTVKPAASQPAKMPAVASSKKPGASTVSRKPSASKAPRKPASSKAPADSSVAE